MIDFKKIETNYYSHYKNPMVGVKSYLEQWVGENLKSKEIATVLRQWQNYRGERCGRYEIYDVDLSNVEFDGQDLSGLIFDRCIMVQTSFKNCVLKNTFFSFCLEHFFFIEPESFEGAIFDNTKIEGNPSVKMRNFLHQKGTNRVPLYSISVDGKVRMY